MPVNSDGIKQLKQEWLDEWKAYITAGFPSFLQVSSAELHWYSEEQLIQKIEENEPGSTWFRLVLLEAMLFEPYYPLGLEKDKKGNDIPSRKYKDIQNAIWGYKKSDGDRYLDELFTGAYYSKGYIKRLRKCYDKVLYELNEVLKTVIVSLSGAALTSACLAYIGGGAIAIGGAGMAGGTIVIVGGGAILGLGIGAGAGGAVGAIGLAGKKNTILQSAKLLVSVREIFLNDEHDLDYSNTIYEKYVQNIVEIEKGLVELRLQADVADSDEKKKRKTKIKEAEDSVEAMKIARKNMARFMSSFKTGMEQP